MENNIFTAYTSAGTVQYSHTFTSGFVEYSYIASYLPTNKEIPRSVWVPTVQEGDALISHWNHQNPFVWHYYQP